jgi:uncharacterized protein (DUF305 family)
MRSHRAVANEPRSVRRVSKRVPKATEVEYLMNTQARMWRLSAGTLLLLLAFLTLERGAGSVVAQGAATPTPSSSCETVTPEATPAMDHGGMTGMGMGTPAAGMETEFDQLYIDMMLAHHASVIALAQAALPRLTDPRLQEMAQAIITAQTNEQKELRSYREQWYGSPDPKPLDQAMMMELLPGMSESKMAEMKLLMDPNALVATFCAAGDPNLAFIDLVIPHHQSAIAASEAALERATHDELKAFAQKVIEDQQREIDELMAIRAELTGTGTPIS